MNSIRTCIACREKKLKNELIRIVKNSNNEICVDSKGKKDGRGAYVCKNAECLEKIKKSKRIERILGIKIPEEIYENLRGVILGK